MVKENQTIWFLKKEQSKEEVNLKDSFIDIGIP